MMIELMPALTACVGCFVVEGKLVMKSAISISFSPLWARDLISTNNFDVN